MRTSRVAAWSGLELVEPLPGGARGTVILARRGATEYVVRVSGRGAEAVDWELDLQQHLASHGVRVPRAVPADDGRRHVGGVMVQERLPGRPPRHADEWARVIDVLRVVHESTRGWAQRPGFAAGRDLQTTLRGGDVDLAAMPADAVALVRRAWRSIDHGPLSAIHGDPGSGNVLVDDRGGIALIDWDESRVDVPWFDFAFLPGEVPAPTSRGRLIAAGLAWEAATSWVTEPGYAAGRLEELRRWERAERHRGPSAERSSRATS